MRFSAVAAILPALAAAQIMQISDGQVQNPVTTPAAPSTYVSPPIYTPPVEASSAPPAESSAPPAVSSLVSSGPPVVSSVPPVVLPTEVAPPVTSVVPVPPPVYSSVGTVYVPTSAAPVPSGNGTTVVAPTVAPSASPSPSSPPDNAAGVAGVSFAVVAGAVFAFLA